MSYKYIKFVTREVTPKCDTEARKMTTLNFGVISRVLSRVDDWERRCPTYFGRGNAIPYPLEFKQSRGRIQRFCDSVEINPIPPDLQNITSSVSTIPITSANSGLRTMNVVHLSSETDWPCRTCRMWYSWTYSWSSTPIESFQSNEIREKWLANYLLASDNL